MSKTQKRSTQHSVRFQVESSQVNQGSLSDQNRKISSYLLSARSQKQPTVPQKLKVQYFSIKPLLDNTFMERRARVLQRINNQLQSQANYEVLNEERGLKSRNVSQKQIKSHQKNVNFVENLQTQPTTDDMREQSKSPSLKREMITSARSVDKAVFQSSAYPLKQSNSVRYLNSGPKLMFLNSGTSSINNDGYDQSSQYEQNQNRKQKSMYNKNQTILAALSSNHSFRKPLDSVYLRSQTSQNSSSSHANRQQDNQTVKNFENQSQKMLIKSQKTPVREKEQDLQDGSVSIKFSQQRRLVKPRAQLPSNIQSSEYSLERAIKSKRGPMGGTQSKLSNHRNSGDQRQSSVPQFVNIVKQESKQIQKRTQRVQALPPVYSHSPLARKSKNRQVEEEIPCATGNHFYVPKKFSPSTKSKLQKRISNLYDKEKQKRTYGLYNQVNQLLNELHVSDKSKNKISNSNSELKDSPTIYKNEQSENDENQDHIVDVHYTQSGYGQSKRDQNQNMAISLLMRRQVELLKTTKVQNDQFARKHEKLLKEKQRASNCCSHRGDSSLRNGKESRSRGGQSGVTFVNNRSQLQNQTDDQNILNSKPTKDSNHHILDTYSQAIIENQEESTNIQLPKANSILDKIGIQDQSSSQNENVSARALGAGSGRNGKMNSYMTKFGGQILDASSDTAQRGLNKILEARKQSSSKVQASKIDLQESARQQQRQSQKLESKNNSRNAPNRIGSSSSCHTACVNHINNLGKNQNSLGLSNEEHQKHLTRHFPLLRQNSYETAVDGSVKLKRLNDVSSSHLQEVLVDPSYLHKSKQTQSYNFLPQSDVFFNDHNSTSGVVTDRKYKNKDSRIYASKGLKVYNSIQFLLNPQQRGHFVSQNKKAASNQQQQQMHVIQSHSFVENQTTTEGTEEEKEKIENSLEIKRNKGVPLHKYPDEYKSTWRQKRLLKPDRMMPQSKIAHIKKIRNQFREICQTERSNDHHNN